MTQRFIVSRHANQRYRERVEPLCSKADACERLIHAAEISRPATPRQIAEAIRCFSGACYRWCPVEQLLLTIRRCEDGRMLIVTVFRCPSDAELREAAVEKRKREKMSRRVSVA